MSSQESDRPSFKQAFRTVLKRNVARVAVLAVLMAIWLIVVFVMNREKGAIFSITPHSMIKGQLVEVLSGDVIKLKVPLHGGEQPVEIRLLAVGAPAGGTAIGKSCRENLIKRLEGQSIWARAVDAEPSGLTIGKVLLSRSGEKPEDLGLSEIRAGCAWYCVRQEKFLSPSDREAYSGAEQQAKGDRIGIWADTSIQRPADCGT